MGFSNAYVEFYEQNILKAFRYYEGGRFNVVIHGLGHFVRKDKYHEAITSVLAKNGFDVAFGDALNSAIDSLHVEYEEQGGVVHGEMDFPFINIVQIFDLASKTGIPPAYIITMQIIANIISKVKIIYKAVILDLDGTLWPGTLAEDGFDSIINRLSDPLNKHFIDFMIFVRQLAVNLGIYVAICSRNKESDVTTFISMLPGELFPLKDQIDCLMVNYNDKSQNVENIARELSILPGALVFVDDNPIERERLKSALATVCLPEWETHSDLVTKLVVGGVFARAELSLNAQERRRQFKILQIERCQQRLPSLSVKVNSDVDHRETQSLYAKSNQFKFSNIHHIGDDARSLYIEIFRQTGDSLGIGSALHYIMSCDTLVIQNWAISCRYFAIGLEEFVLLKLLEMAGSKKLVIDYSPSPHNHMCAVFIDKYLDFFRSHEDGDNVQIVIAPEAAFRTILMNNTRLIEV